ncbi:hypothetical protein [Amorphus sp. MBR-141]
MNSLQEIFLRIIEAANLVTEPPITWEIVESYFSSVTFWAAAAALGSLLSAFFSLLASRNATRTTAELHYSERIYELSRELFDLIGEIDNDDAKLCHLEARKKYKVVGTFTERLHIRRDQCARNFAVKGANDWYLYEGYLASTMLANKNRSSAGNRKFRKILKEAARKYEEWEAIEQNAGRAGGSDNLPLFRFEITQTPASPPPN